MCDHDFENVTMKGRATWFCPKCNKDISFEYLCWYEATMGGTRGRVSTAEFGRNASGKAQDQGGR
jgi:hypothetical protein